MHIELYEIKLVINFRLISFFEDQKRHSHEAKNDMQRLNRVVLGTAQIGMQYGFSTNLPSFQKSLSILDRSYELGIRSLDTAAVYGHSERRIGDWLRLSPSKRTVKITTKLRKLPSFDTAGEVETFVRMELEQSCKRLDSDKIDGYMSHEFRDILNARVQEALFEAQSQGRIDKFGASCYEPYEILTARENCSNCNLFQIPANILDRRLFEIVPKMQSLDSQFKQAQVMIRSIFARGIITSTTTLSRNISHLRKPVALIHEMAKFYELSVPAFCLNYILSKYPDASVTFGIYEVNQLDFIEEFLGKEKFTKNILANIEKQISISAFDPIDLRTIK